MCSLSLYVDFSVFFSPLFQFFKLDWPLSTLSSLLSTLISSFLSHFPPPLLPLFSSLRLAESLD